MAHLSAELGALATVKHINKKWQPETTDCADEHEQAELTSINNK